MIQRVFWGPIHVRANEAISDITIREVFVVAPLVVLVVWIGVHPNTFLEPMEASVRLLLGR
jgi:NADH-quinone oxidoreductase subunit M